MGGKTFDKFKKSALSTNKSEIKRGFEVFELVRVETHPKDPSESGKGKVQLKLNQESSADLGALEVLDSYTTAFLLDLLTKAKYFCTLNSK